MLQLCVPVFVSMEKGEWTLAFSMSLLYLAEGKSKEDKVLKAFTKTGSQEVTISSTES